MLRILVEASKISKASDEYKLLTQDLNSWGEQFEQCDTSLITANQGEYADKFHTRSTDFTNGSYADLKEQAELTGTVLEAALIKTNGLINRCTDYGAILNGESALGTEDYESAGNGGVDILFFEDQYSPQESGFAGAIKEDTEHVIDLGVNETEDITGIHDALSNVKSVSVDVSSLTAAITECVNKQQRVTPLYDSHVAYGTGVAELNDYVTTSYSKYTGGYAMMNLAHYRDSSRSSYLTTNQAGLKNAFTANALTYAVKLNSPATASTTGGTTSQYLKLRQELMDKYGVSEEIMQKIDTSLQGWQLYGQNDYEDILDKYSNMTDEELRDEIANNPDAAEDLAYVAALYVYAASALESDSISEDDKEMYTNICEEITSAMYRMDKEPGFMTDGQSSVNHELVSIMKKEAELMGATDSLAYNILTKVDSDSNTYYNDEYRGDPVKVHTHITQGEDGFFSVEIEDGFLARERITERTFLATSRDNAVRFLNDNKTANSAWHGVTTDETIALIMSAGNYNDVQIAKNIIASDGDYKLSDGKYAFDIEMRKNDVDEHYEDGLTDLFSISMAQYANDMLIYGNDDKYVQLASALMNSSGDANQSSEVLLDIASGAGALADLIATRVYDDPVGGGNDEDLKIALNAANASFGFFSQLYTAVGSDGVSLSSTYNSDVGITDFSFDSQTGTISAKIAYDSTTYYPSYVPSHSGYCPTGPMPSTVVKTREYYDITSEIQTGTWSSTKGYSENRQRELKEALEKKEARIVVDSFVDIVGIANPTLKSALKIGVDVAFGSNATNDVIGLSKDTSTKLLEAIYPKGNFKTYGNCFGAGKTILSGLISYQDAIDKYKKDMEESETVEKLAGFYSYNTGSHSVGIYDYDVIRAMQAWDNEGVSHFLDEDNNYYSDLVYSNDGSINPEVLKNIGVDLADTEHGLDFLTDETVDASDRLEDGYEYIEKYSNGKYTQEQIETALDIMINGANNDMDKPYQTIMQIPYELLAACADAINKCEGVDEDLMDEIVKEAKI